MTIANRPAFGLQTAYFGNALTGKSSAMAPQTPAIQTAPQFGCEDKVQFAGQGIPRRVVLGTAGAAAVAVLSLGLSGCGGTSQAAGNGSGSSPVAAASSNTHGTSCKAITSDDAFTALHKASGIPTSELKAKLSKLSPRGVYGLSLLGPLAKDALNNSAVMKQVETVGKDKSGIETARVAIFNLIYLDAKDKGATHPEYAGYTASIDLGSQQLLDNNTQAFEGKNDPGYFSAMKNRWEQKGSDKVPGNYTGPGSQYLSDANKHGLKGLISTYQDGAFFSMYNPVVKTGKADEAISKLNSIPC